MLVLVNVLFLLLAFYTGIYLCNLFKIENRINGSFVIMFLTLIVILVQAKIFNIGQYFLQPHMHNSEYILKTIPMIIKALFPL